MIRIYLDTSAYQRPFDDQSQPRIFLESQAVVMILQMVEAKMVDLASSSVLEYENSRNPYPIKQVAMNRYLRLAGLRCEVDESILSRGEALEGNGLKAMDALHVACAEVLDCDYLITCDKRLINRSVGLPVKVINPLDLILEISNDDPG